MYHENYLKLKEQLKLETKFTFNYNVLYSLLPLRTRTIDKIKFQHGCLPIIGMLGRLSLGKQMELLETDEIVSYMLEEGAIEFEDDVDKSDFDLLIQQYLGGNQLNIFNPHLFLYVPLFDLKIENFGQKMAEFVNEIFFKEIDLTDFFEGKNSNYDNVIVEFIISNLKELDDEQNKLDEYIVPECMNDVVQIIQNDFKFLLKNEEFLVNNFDLILAYYLNFYFIQFVFKNNSVSNPKELFETFYVLDWEKVSSDRAENPNGFKLFEKFLKDLLYDMVIVEHLNMLLGTKSLLLPEITLYYNNLDDVDKNEILKYFKRIIVDIIHSEEKLDNNIIRDVENYENFEDLLNFYNKFIHKVVNVLNRKSPFGKYSDGIMKLSKKYFVKQRGKNGNMFNITQEMLMIITAISIQDADKIRFNKLMEEFRKRGLFFDIESKKRIMERFNTLNLIEAKSDIGEEAYVKSIL